MARVIGILPARGGSKRVARKNLHLLGGYPLIAWVLRAAQKTSLDALVVSTDDGEIAQVAEQYYGVRVLSRPPELAQDETPDLPVFLHALSELGTGMDDLILHLRATSPLVQPEDIESVIRLARHVTPSSVLSIREVRDPPHKMYYDGVWLRSLMPSGHAPNSPSQFLTPRVWAAAGYLDAIPARVIYGGRMEQDPVPWLPPMANILDLDTEEDFERAEAMIAQYGYAPV